MTGSLTTPGLQVNGNIGVTGTVDGVDISGVQAQIDGLSSRMDTAHNADGTIKAGAVGATQVDSNSTRSVGLTPFAFGSLASPDNGCTILAQYNVSSAVVTSETDDCLAKAAGCRITFETPADTGNYIVVVTNLSGQNGTDDNSAACKDSSSSTGFIVSGGPSSAKVDFIVFKP
jgi:hypothetical protein